MRNDVIDEVIVGRVVPHIYAFETDTYPKYLKVGDTYRPVPKRLAEWKVLFPGLQEVCRCEAAISGSNVYFRDYSVHAVLEEKNFSRLDRATAVKLAKDSDAPFSNEFFKDARDVDVVEAVKDIKDDFAAKTGKFDFYSTDDLDRKKAKDDDDLPPPVALKLRGNQEDVVANFEKAVRGRRTNLLMYAVMRFGKTVTALACARRMDARFVVVVSGKADVRREWRMAVKGFTCFSDYVFVTQADVGDNYDYITNLLKAKKRIVYFDTLQDFCDKKGKVEIKPKHLQIFREKIDLLIVDETHFAARAENCGKILQGGKTVEAKPDDASEETEVGAAGAALKDVREKVLRARVTLHLSGTPYRILMGSEFQQEDIIAFYSFTDIVHAQKEWDAEHLGKARPDGSEYEEWDNDYFGFPEMVRFAFNLNRSALAKLEELEKQGVSSRFGELLKTESLSADKSAKKRHRKFVHEPEVIDLFQTIGGVKSDPSIMDFLSYDRIRDGQMCHHMVCVLPWKSSCDALARLLKDRTKRFGRLNEYVVLNVAGHDCRKGLDTPDKVIRLIAENERIGKKTLTLTVDKMLTGNTVPEWDTMLFMKDTSSPQQYDQAIFRLQSSYIREMASPSGKRIRENMKPQTLLVDFDPHRMFYLQEQRAQYYNVNMGDKGNAAVLRRIKEELAASPVVRFGADGIRRVTPTDVMAAVSAYSAKRGVADEVRDTPITAKELTDPSLVAIMSRFPPMGSREGLTIAPHVGEETNPEANVGGGTDPEKEPPKRSPLPKTKDEYEELAKRFQTYRSLILFFAFLTKDVVSSLDDILERMNSSADNRRIAGHLGMVKNEVAAYRQALDWYTLRDFDLKIHNMNWLSREQKDIDLGSDYADVPASVRRAIVAMNKFGRLGRAKIVTPPNIAYDMVKQIPAREYRAFLRRGEKILDLSTKMGEFAIAQVRRALDKDVALEMADIRSSFLAIPMCGVTYEFTRKVYELLGLDATCIAEPEKINTFDLLNIKDESGSLDYEQIRKLLTQDKPFNKITKKDEVLTTMKSTTFAAVVSNPPYQKDDGGNGDSASPVYDLLTTACKAVSSKYVDLIMPARWFTGGKGLDDFRAEMLADRRICSMTDFANSKDCFPGMSVSGGICYLLWDRNHNGRCNFVSSSNKDTSSMSRKLDEFPIFVRYNKAVDVIHKVKSLREESLQTILTSRNPYGIATSARGAKKPFAGSYLLVSSKGDGYINKSEILSNLTAAGAYKVMVTRIMNEHAGEPDKNGQLEVIATLRILKPREVCTDSYITCGSFKTLSQAKNLLSYLKTKFVRFLILQAAASINLSRAAYQFVPMQDFGEAWTDEKLYRKYGITKEEQAFIESMIKPMA